MDFLADLLPNLTLGFTTVISPTNLFYCFTGVLVGTVIGVLPGIGPLAAMSMLLPITFTLPPIGALIMLAGIYYGAMYGGAITSILLNMPGEASHVVTCLDGHQLALKGRAGPSLAIAAIASFFGGTVGAIVIVLAGPPLAGMALSFAAPEYFSLMLMGLIAAAALGQGSPMKAIAMVVLGLLLGLVGSDVNTGLPRFTFGILGLNDGISFVVVAMGLFGITEIAHNLEQSDEDRHQVIRNIKGIWPTRSDFKVAAKPALRGTALGSLFGALPGAGATIAAFSSYALEKKIAKDPSRFGKGAIEGIAGPESANNAAAQCAFIPTLTLGIPGSVAMALVLGVLTIHGITPGPLIMTQQPDLFWGLIVSMWVGNIMLLILNLPMVGVWARLLMVPYRLLLPAIVMCMTIGVYSVNNNALGVYLTVAFGLLGYLFVKLRCEPAPLILAFVLGPLMEEHLRRALLISRGDAMVFVERPISAAFLLLTVIILVLMLRPRRAKPAPAET